MTPRELLREYARAYVAYMDVCAAPAPALYDHVISLEEKLVKLMGGSNEHG